MDRFDRVEALLSEEFEVFVVIGSNYNAETGDTTVSSCYVGNSYAIDGMVKDFAESRKSGNHSSDGDEQYG